MGKYIKKGKIAGEVAVMEVSHQSSLGVRTRARTLALQRLQRASSPTPSPSPTAENDDGSYLQLRSRRLEKALVAASRTKEKDSFKDGSKPGNPRKTPSDPAAPRPRLAACSANSVPTTKGCTKNSTRAWEELEEASLDNDGVEASSGENVLEFDIEDRSARETTPCSSFIRDSDAAGTPGSTTRRRTMPDARQRAARRGIPTSDEMEEFFAGAEQWQQRIFIDKYNFDPVNDRPLPGRYEWVRLDS